MNNQTLQAYKKAEKYIKDLTGHPPAFSGEQLYIAGELVKGVKNSPFRVGLQTAIASILSDLSDNAPANSETKKARQNLSDIANKNSPNNPHNADLPPFGNPTDQKVEGSNPSKCTSISLLFPACWVHNRGGLCSLTTK